MFDNEIEKCVTVPSMADTSILLTIPEALARVSVGRSYFYERLAEGCIRSVKAGRRRLIDAASLQNWAASLPESQLKQSPKGIQR